MFARMPKGSSVTWDGRAMTVVHDGGGFMLLLEDEAGRQFAPFRHEVEA